MKPREELKALLESMHTWNLSLFYSDEEVRQILDKLYARWEANNRRGEPLDYASEAEVHKLLTLAKKYARIPPWQAYRTLLARMLS